MADKRCILVTGGSGYLGQFLVDALRAEHRVLFTYSSRQLEIPEAEGFKVDLVTGEGLQEVFSQGPIHAVINCAAISLPGACEKDPGAARVVNVPTALLASLKKQQEQCGVRALLIHLSTDQVYDGRPPPLLPEHVARSKAGWVEGDECKPVNAYGRSKLEAEEAIEDQWPLHHAILRSSIILGPHPPFSPLPRTLFLHFVDEALSSGAPTTFFEDEWRCPVYVQDIVQAVQRLLAFAPSPAGPAPAAPPHHLFNMGGPERLSRADMARKVAEVRGHPQDLIVPAPSASVSRGVASPADISMCSDRLVQALGVTLTPFEQAVRASLG